MLFNENAVRNNFRTFLKKNELRRLKIAYAIYSGKYYSQNVSPKVKDIYQVQKKLTSKQESIIILIFYLASGPDQHQRPSFGPKVT